MVALNSRRADAVAWAPPLGEVTTLVATTTTGTWPAGTRMVVGDSSDTIATGTVLGAAVVSVDGLTATWALDEAQCAILRAHTRLLVQVPSGAAWDGILAGAIAPEPVWSGARSVQTIGAVLVGPQGPPGIGADPETIGVAVQAYLAANPPAIGALTDLSDVTIGDSTEGDVLTLGPLGEWGPAPIPAPDLSGYAPDTHTHAVADIDATGTPSASTYLRGDGSWATPPAGGTGAVDSVNGQTGAVTLDAADVGADPAGTAAALVAGVEAGAGGLPRALSLVAAKLASVDVAPVNLLFLGDSLTWSGSAWVDLCVKRLGQAVDQSPRPTPLKSKVAGDISIPATGIYAVNCAADGASSGNYITNGNAVAMATALQPALVVHGVGTNDFLGSMSPTGAYTNGIRSAITAVDAACTVPPVHLFWWFGSNYNQSKPYTSDQYISALMTIAADYPGRMAVLDLGPYADTLGVHAADLYALDGGDTIHLSAAGSRMVGELMARALLAAPPVGVLGWSAAAPAAADTTAPAWTATLTTGTPAQTSVVVAASALATDAVGVTAYEVSVNAGTDWATIVPSGLNFTIAGLTASTSYPAPQFRAKDAAGNISTPVLSAQSFTTADPVADSTPPIPGTLTGSAITDTTFTLTITGASDAGAGLHATPYAFSTDNGATWGAWQAGATLAVTGKTASTGYQCQHKVRDAAGTPNEATGSAITVTTTATPAGPTTITDSFNRADSATSLGNTDTGQTWVQVGTGILGIKTNSAYTPTNTAATGIAVVNFGQTDMEVSVVPSVVTTAGPAVSVCTTSAGAEISSAWSFVWNSPSAIKFGNSYGGTTPYVAGDKITLMAKKSGANTVLTILVNDVSKLTQTLTGIQAPTENTYARLAIGAYGGTVRVDSFEVKAPA